MEKQNLYKAKMAAQLHEWTAQMNLFEAKMEHAGASLQLKGKEEIAALRAKQHVAVRKMRELAQSSDASWDQIKLATDKMWDDLKSGVNAAQSKFK